MAHVQIEMVGWFVQQQQIGPLPDQQRQRQPRLFPAGEGRHRFQRPVAVKAETADEIAQCLLAGALVQFLQMPQRAPVRPQLLQLVLGKIADGQTLTDGYPPGQRRQYPGQQLDQGRFAGAVRAE